MHPRPKVFELLDLLEDDRAFLLFNYGPGFRGRRFLGSHWGNLRLFAAPKRRLVCAIHLARKAGWHRADFAEARTLDDGPS